MAIGEVVEVCASHGAVGWRRPASCGRSNAEQGASPLGEWLRGIPLREPLENGLDGVGQRDPLALRPSLRPDDHPLVHADRKLSLHAVRLATKYTAHGQ